MVARKSIWGIAASAPFPVGTILKIEFPIKTPDTVFSAKSNISIFYIRTTPIILIAPVDVRFPDRRNLLGSQANSKVVMHADG